MTLLLVPPPVIMKYLGCNKSKAKITNKSAATHKSSNVNFKAKKSMNASATKSYMVSAKAVA